MDVLCHLTGLHFPLPLYHSSQNVSFMTLRGGGMEGWGRGLKERK